MKPARTSTRIHVHCPNCGEEDIRVDHLFGDKHRPVSFGPWSCKHCGRSYQGRVLEGNAVEVAVRDEQDIPTLSLLVLKPEDAPVFFVVKGSRSVNPNRPSDRDEHESNRFLYEEHSCPTNFIRCEAIIADSDSDPHGVFEYVRTVDCPPHPDDNNSDRAWPDDNDSDRAWYAIFPEAFPEAFPGTKP
jgi:ribosomal protein L37AE/L43A